MSPQSLLYQMDPSRQRAGRCQVCAQPTWLEFYDSSTTFRLGRCCLTDLVRAEYLLAHVPGLTHPASLCHRPHLRR